MKRKNAIAALRPLRRRCKRIPRLTVSDRSEDPGGNLAQVGNAPPGIGLREGLEARLRDHLQEAMVHLFRWFLHRSAPLKTKGDPPRWRKGQGTANRPCHHLCQSPEQQITEPLRLSPCHMLVKLNSSAKSAERPMMQEASMFRRARCA